MVCVHYESKIGLPRKSGEGNRLKDAFEHQRRRSKNLARNFQYINLEKPLNCSEFNFKFLTA